MLCKWIWQPFFEKNPSQELSGTTTKIYLNFWRRQSYIVNQQHWRIFLSSLLASRLCYLIDCVLNTKATKASQRKRQISNSNYSAVRDMENLNAAKQRLRPSRKHEERMAQALEHLQLLQKLQPLQKCDGGLSQLSVTKMIQSSCGRLAVT